MELILICVVFFVIAPLCFLGALTIGLRLNERDEKKRMRNDAGA